MKFNVQSKLLLSRLNAVSKVVSSNNAFAILDNFLFELQSDRIVVTGSDMETRLTTNIEVQNVEGTGKFALDVKRTINSLKESGAMWNGRKSPLSRAHTNNCTHTMSKGITYSENKRKSRVTPMVKPPSCMAFRLSSQ